ATGETRIMGDSSTPGTGDASNLERANQNRLFENVEPHSPLESNENATVREGSNLNVNGEQRQEQVGRLRHLMSGSGDTVQDPLSPQYSVGSLSFSRNLDRGVNSDSSSSDDEVDARAIGNSEVTQSSDSDDSETENDIVTQAKLLSAYKGKELSSPQFPLMGNSNSTAKKGVVDSASVFEYFKNKDNFPLFKKMKMDTDDDDNREKNLQRRPHYLERCQKCNQPGDYVCKGCFRVVYCCQEHQSDDWSSHRRSCLHFGLEFNPSVLYRGPFRIYPNDELGPTNTGEFQKYTMKAKVTIPQDKVILEEKPFLVCPWPRTKIRQAEQGLFRGFAIRNLSCFGCGKVLGFSSVRCSECDLYMCSDNCPYLECHRDCECKIIQQQLETGKTAKSNDPRLNLKNIANDQYREWIYLDVMILRLLRKISDMKKSMSPENFQEKWAVLNTVWKSNSHVAGTERREIVKKNIRTYLKFSYKATDSNSDLVWKLFCIVDMNSFVYELPFQRFKVLCTVLGTASHSCNPNSVAFLKQPDMDNIDINQPECHPDDLTIVLKSGQPIVSGTAVTFPYIPLILTTQERRTALHNTFMHFCTCARCMDPTELGTYVASVRCLGCTSGVLIPTKDSVCVTSMEAFKQKQSDWECRLPNSTGKVGCRRTSPLITHQDLTTKLKSTETSSHRYLINPTKAKAYLFQRPENINCFSSATLKVCEDILRGTFYPLPDVLAEDLKDFKDDALICIILARNLYRDFMKKVHPGFNFEGFAVANYELAENELRGRENGELIFSELCRHERRPARPYLMTSSSLRPI
ncbi:Protein msta, isoform B, partial [Orchesella cincta]